jgi:hypothetical protein
MQLQLEDNVMARLPIPGSDDHIWGGILNDFLGVAHNSDGSLQLQAINAAGGYVLPVGGMPLSNLDVATQAIISSVAGKYVKPTGGIPATDLSAATQTSLSLAMNGIQLGGDIGGTITSPSVLKVNGIAVSGTPNVSQALIATSNTSAAWANLPAAPTATSSTVGLIQLTGDLSGTATTPRVTSIQGVTVPGSAPTTAGQVLTSTSPSAMAWQTPSAGSSIYINVKDYGATGNGSTDDTAGIQAAINAANTAGGGTVYIPPGIYVVATSVPLRPLSNVKIQGSGEASVLTTAAITGTGVNIFQGINSPSSVLTDVEICDLKIDGSHVTASSYNSSQGKGIFLEYCERLKIHGVYMYGTWTSGFGTDFLVDSEIDRCVADTCGRGWASGDVGGNGFGIGSGYYANESWVISNCIAKNIGNNGFIAEDQFQTTHSRDMILSHCISYSNGQNGFRNSGTSGVTFSSCYTFGNAQSGFYLAHGLGNYATSYNPQDVNILGCTSYGNTLYGIGVEDQIPAGNLFNITIANCEVFNNTSSYGIYLHDTYKVAVMGNRVYGNGLHGMYVLCDTAVVPMSNFVFNSNSCFNNSTSTTNTYDGIHIANASGTMSDALIVGNRCWDDQTIQTQRYGLYIGGTISNVVATGNDLSGNVTGGYHNTSTGTGVNAFNNLGVSTDPITGTQTAGYVLRSNGSTVALAALQASDIPTLNQNTTGNAATATVSSGLKSATTTVTTSTATAPSSGQVLTATSSTAATWQTLSGTGNMNTSTYDPAAIVQQILGTTASQTFSNKRYTRRVLTVVQSATPIIDTDNTDVASITGLAQAITSMSTNVTGTPNDGDLLLVRLTDNGTARSVTWGSLFESSGTVSLPTTTVPATLLAVGFMWNTATSKWRCIGVA